MAKIEAMKRRNLIILIILTISLSVLLNYFGVFNIKAAPQIADKTVGSLIKSNAKQTGRWLKTLEDRPGLSQKDKKAKEKIIAPLSKVKNKSGYLVQTSWYNIEYVSNADEFFVEIKDTNTQFGKYWATMWFKLNGISDEGLCKLPVVFYPNWHIARQIKNLNIEFNPLADTCK